MLVGCFTETECKSQSRTWKRVSMLSKEERMFVVCSCIILRGKAGKLGVGKFCSRASTHSLPVYFKLAIYILRRWMLMIFSAYIRLLDFQVFIINEASLRFLHFFYLLSNEVWSNYCKRVCLFSNFSLDRFCAFFREYSQVTFSRFRSSFLSGLYCSHSEVKLAANINSITTNQNGPDNRVGSASGQGSGGQLFESQHGQLFLHPLRKKLSRLQPLN